MIDEAVLKLSELFRPLGTIPFGEWVGQPRFQYRRGRDLRIPYRKPGDAGTKMVHLPSGLYAMVPQYDLGYQTSPDDHRWHVVQWTPAGMSPAEWAERYYQIPYPASGQWMSYTPTKPDFTPNHDWTIWMRKELELRLRAKDRNLPQAYREELDHVQGHLDRKKASAAATIADAFDDAIVKSVPGKRGGAVSYPSTRFSHPSPAPRVRSSRATSIKGVK